MQKKNEMKKIPIILLALCFWSCDRNEVNDNCNFLLDVGVDFVANLNLPQFNQLQFPVNAVRVEGQGNNGLILVRSTSSSLIAWDGADPNHPPSSCNGLSINNDGITATCGCGDENTYNLVNGLATTDNPQPCTLKAYRVEPLGNNTFLISN